MARTKKTRKHEVRATLTIVELTKAGTSLELEIKGAGEKIGHLIIGRGSLRWFGAKRQKSKRISWSAFARQMDQLAYGE